MIVASFGRYTVETGHDHGNGRRWPPRSVVQGTRVADGAMWRRPVCRHCGGLHDVPCLAPGLAPHRPGAHPGGPAAIPRN